MRTLSRKDVLNNEAKQVFRGGGSTDEIRVRLDDSLAHRGKTVNDPYGKHQKKFFLLDAVKFENPEMAYLLLEAYHADPNISKKIRTMASNMAAPRTPFFGDGLVSGPISDFMEQASDAAKVVDLLINGRFANRDSVSDSALRMLEGIIAKFSTPS